MESLPISLVKDEIVAKLQISSTLIIVASTGSGKSTLLPGILVSNGFSDNGIIGISQPRRVAALSLAKRVSYLLNCKVGEFVGVSVRFYNNVTSKTRVLFATDGMLVREALVDNQFSKYSTIIVDEAHERSLRSDVLFSLLVLAQKKRPELKIIIMSATLECEKFLNFFTNAQLMNVEGRQFPIEIHHIKSEYEDYLEAAVAAVFLINSKGFPGDILVFLPGQEEIENFCAIMNSKMEKIDNVKNDTCTTVLLKVGKKTCNYNDWMKMKILPLYAALPLSQQEHVFLETKGFRKVIACTNIAETSLTIPGVRFVVDSGLEKQRFFSAKRGIEVLALKIISKASARQRAGRAGRESQGFVYRIYTKDSFDKMAEFTVPEIQRSDVTQTFLELAAIGINGISEFPLVDSPSQESFLVAAATLCRLGALDRSGNITELGKLIVKIPTNPIYAKMLIIAKGMNCFSDLLTLVSMLSTDSPWIINFSGKDCNKLKNAKILIANASSDHLTLVNLYNLYKKSKKPEDFCITFGIKHNVMKYSDQIRSQLEAIFQGLEIDKIKLNLKLEPPEFEETSDEIIWVLAQGSWIKTAILEPDKIHYRTIVENQRVKIHQSSGLNRNKLPICIVYDECVSTSATFVRIVSSIDKFDIRNAK